MSHESPELLEDAAERESRWFAEQEKISRLDDLAPEDLSPAFEHEPGVCTCVDEGTTGDIRIAGSGILHPGGIDAVASVLQEAGVREITSHDECGAVKEAYRRANGLSADAELDPEAVTAFGQDWSIRLSERLGVPYRHIATDEMQRPANWHDAATVYLDFSGRFQPHAVADLPKGFVISGELLTPEELHSDATFTASIAMSAKGFGERFSQEHPLVVVAVGDVTAEYDRVIQSIAEEQRGRIVVKRLPVPDLIEAVA